MNFNDVMNYFQEQMNIDAYNRKTPTYGAAEIMDINYMGDGNPNHELDVYAPGFTADKLPVIVMIHGGGYVSNKKVCNRPHGMWLASQGYKVVNVEYTLVPQATIAEEIKEITAAFQWIEDNEDEYGFDTGNMFLIGDSSGGHLALLMAAVQNNKELQQHIGVEPVASGIRAVEATCPVGFFGGHGLVAKMTPALFKLFHLEIDPYGLENAINEDFMDCLLITAPTDAIAHANTAALHKWLVKQGISHDYLNMEGDENKLPHVFNVLMPDWPESVTANTVLIDFFEERMA